MNIGTSTPAPAEMKPFMEAMNKLEGYRAQLAEHYLEKKCSARDAVMIVSDDTAPRSNLEPEYYATPTLWASRTSAAQLYPIIVEDFGPSVDSNPKAIVAKFLRAAPPLGFITCCLSIQGKQNILQVELFKPQPRQPFAADVFEVVDNHKTAKDKTAFAADMEALAYAEQVRVSRVFLPKYQQYYVVTQNTTETVLFRLPFTSEKHAVVMVAKDASTSLNRRCRWLAPECPQQNEIRTMLQEECVATMRGNPPAILNVFEVQG